MMVASLIASHQVFESSVRDVFVGCAQPNPALGVEKVRRVREFGFRGVYSMRLNFLAMIDHVATMAAVRITAIKIFQIIFLGAVPGAVAMVMRRTTATVKSVTSIVVAICFPPVLALSRSLRLCRAD